MQKNAVILMFITLLMLGTAEGYRIRDIMISDHLNEDNSIVENLYITVADNSRESFSFTFPQGAYSITMDGVQVTTMNNSALLPLRCENCSLNISYSLGNAVKKDRDVSTFSRTLNFPQIPASLEYMIYLTPGYIIEYNPADPSIVPTQTSIETDGKHIIIQWNETKPDLPKRYFVRYKDSEQATTPTIGKELTELPVIIMLMVTFIISVIFGYALSRLSRKAKDRIALPYVPASLLNPDENAVIKKLKENHNKMSQKELVRSLDWSKSKVSAIVTNLEYKKIIAREKIGRSYKVELVKEIGE